MTPEVYHILQKNIDMALNWDYKMLRYFLLEDRDGIYLSPKGNKNCHPLETIVLGQKIVTTINEDIMTNLGVSSAWIDGFTDGFGHKRSSTPYMNLALGDPVHKDYLEGYNDGQSVEQWLYELGE